VYGILCPRPTTNKKEFLNSFYFSFPLRHTHTYIHTTMPPRLNIPPVTRILLIALLSQSLLSAAIRYRQWTKESDIVVPYLSLVPQLSFIYPWTFLTTTLVENNVFTLGISAVTLFYGGRYLERAWTSAEFAKFVVVVALIPNLLTFGLLVGLFALMGDMRWTYVFSLSLSLLPPLPHPSHINRRKLTTPSHIQSHLHQRDHPPPNLLPNRLLPARPHAHRNSLQRAPLSARTPLPPPTHPPHPPPNIHPPPNPRLPFALPLRLPHLLHLPPLLQIRLPRPRQQSRPLPPRRRIRVLRFRGVLPRRAQTLCCGALDKYLRSPRCD
jgi:membrane associated rhomboid family serine protease